MLRCLWWSKVYIRVQIVFVSKFEKENHNKKSNNLEQNYESPICPRKFFEYFFFWFFKFRVEKFWIFRLLQNIILYKTCLKISVNSFERKKNIYSSWIHNITIYICLRKYILANPRKITRPRASTRATSSGSKMIIF